MSEEGPHSSQNSRPLRAAAQIAFALFAIWTLLPALTSVHLEAFSAQLQSMAILLNRHGSHGLALADQSYPITTEFLYMSRSGLVAALQILIKLSGQSGDIVFRVLMLASMATFILSSLSVAQRWTKEPRILLFAVLLLTPGMVEIAFFFSDNLPSAALAMLALACVPKEKSSDLRWLAVGALFAASILVRFDAVTIAPALAICLLLNKPTWITAAKRTTLFLAALVLTILLAQRLTPFRLTEDLQITKLFSTLHEWIQGDSRLHEVSLGFFGALTPLLVLIGIVQNCRRQKWPWILALVVLPALFYLAVLPKAIEIRMFLLLGAPALLIHGATGISTIAKTWTSSKALVPTLVRPISLSLALFVLLGPVDLVIRDGPRTAYGRIWATLIWQEWQQNVNDGMHKLDDVVASIQPGQPVLAISSHYNADDYFRLRLLQQGFDIIPTNKTSEVFQKGSRVVAHIRCPDPYLIMGQWYGQSWIYTEATQILWSLNETDPSAYKRFVLLNWQEAPGFFSPALPDIQKDHKLWQITLPQASIVPRKGPVTEGAIDTREITSAQLDAIHKQVQKEVGISIKHAKNWTPIQTYPEFHSKFIWRFGPAP